MSRFTELIKTKATFKKIRNRKRNKKGGQNVKAKKAMAQSKQDRLIASLADRYLLLSISTEQRDKLEKELKSDLNLEETAVLRSKQLWDALDQSGHRLVIENADANYLQTFIIAWKIHDYISSSKDRLLKEIPRLAKRAGMKITAKFDPLIATFRSTIQYGDRRLWSRDAQAVRWLQRKGQTPDTVIKYQKAKGGGVDPWARKEQKRRKQEKLKAGGTPKPEKTTAAMRIAALRKELPDGQGAVLMVKKRGTMLVSLGFIKLKKADKSKVWPKIKQAVTGLK